MPNTRANDFRYSYGNIFTFNLSASELTLVAGLQSSPGTEDLTMEEQAGIIVSLVSAKLLVTILSRLLDDFEEATQTVIPVDPAKLESLDRAIQAGREARAGKPATT